MYVSPIRVGSLGRYHYTNLTVIYECVRACVTGPEVTRNGIDLKAYAIAFHIHIFYVPVPQILILNLYVSMQL